MADSLNGLNLLVTRPKHQAQPLCKLIEDNGGNAIVFPTIEIKPLRTDVDISNDDIAIFVSANAVCLNAAPPNLTIVAIGPGTAKELEKNNCRVDFIPDQYNSEGLLVLPILNDVNGKSIVIFCGENSRSLLKDTLQERGAHVKSAICYRRECPATHANPGPIDCIISTSQESLTNLVRLLPEAIHKPLLVISPAMRGLASQLGFSEVLMASNASDQAILSKLFKKLTIYPL